MRRSEFVTKTQFPFWLYFYLTDKLFRTHTVSTKQCTILIGNNIETSFLWVEFLNKNRCISVRLVSEEDKRLNFENFDNSHNSFLWPEYFIDFYVNDGSHVRLRHPSVFTLPPRDSTLQYKKCVKKEITFLALVPWRQQSLYIYINY